MSGGHYAYAYQKVRDMADQMDDDIEDGEIVKMYDNPTRYNVKLRKEVIDLLREVSDLMRAIEWEDSGDGADWEKLAKNLLAGRWR